MEWHREVVDTHMQQGKVRPRPAVVHDAARRHMQHLQTPAGNTEWARKCQLSSLAHGGAPAPTDCRLAAPSGVRIQGAESRAQVSGLSKYEFSELISGRQDGPHHLRRRELSEICVDERRVGPKWPINERSARTDLIELQGCFPTRFGSPSAARSAAAMPRVRRRLR